MFLTKIVFIVFTCIELINYKCVIGQEPSGEDDDDTMENPSEEEVEEPVTKENQTFVALLEILFVDGRKRSCTGTIIHDNVVITAAHCFRNRANPYVEPELTASFVVIGTKKMFDTGYEDYLPIERVITHPKYKGWTANIALVYTFSGLTNCSGRLGSSIPLVGERTLTPVDSNVTVLSWGQCTDQEPSTYTRITPPPTADDDIDSCNPDEDSCEPNARTPAGGDQFDSISFENTDGVKAERQLSEEISEAENEKQFGRQQPHTQTIANEQTKIRRATKKGDQYMIPLQNYSPDAAGAEKYHVDMSREKDKQRNKQKRKVEKIIKGKELFGEKEISREKGESEIEKENYKYERHHYQKAKRNTTSSGIDYGKPLHSPKDLTFRVRKSKHPKRKKVPKRKDMSELIDFQINRRSMPRSNTNSSAQNTTEQIISKQNVLAERRQNGGTKTNTLTVETFGFVNVQQCKKMVERAMPPKFEINPNYVVCYSSDNHYITDEDSGAPAIRQGHLVALTIGGVECEGEHVAIGMKMSCFCPWIAENLPNDAGKDLKCCGDCCDNENQQKSAKHKHRYV